MNKLGDILTGSNDDDLLYELYRRIERPRNPAQAVFVDAWQLSEFIASDGFEILFEQERSIDEFAELFANIGFTEALPVFQRVKAVVPNTMLSKNFDVALGDHLRANCERLKELLYEYFDVSNAHLMPAFAGFVRKHHEEFSEHLASNANDG